LFDFLLWFHFETIKNVANKPFFFTLYAFYVNILQFPLLNWPQFSGSLLAIWSSQPSPYMQWKLNWNLCLPTLPTLRFFVCRTTPAIFQYFLGRFSLFPLWQTCWHFSLDASHQINARKICICMSGKRVYCKQNICTRMGVAAFLGAARAAGSGAWWQHANECH